MDGAVDKEEEAKTSDRRLRAICEKSCRQFSLALQTRMPGSGTMRAKACTILPRWPRERF